jgi:hypothetical protein
MPRIIDRENVAAVADQLRQMAHAGAAASSVSNAALAVVDSWLASGPSAGSQPTSLYLHCDKRWPTADSITVSMVGVEFDPRTGRPQRMHVADVGEPLPPSALESDQRTSDEWVTGDTHPASAGQLSLARSPTYTPPSSLSSLAGPHSPETEATPEVASPGIVPPPPAQLPAGPDHERARCSEQAKASAPVADCRGAGHAAAEAPLRATATSADDVTDSPSPNSAVRGSTAPPTTDTAARASVYAIFAGLMHSGLRDGESVAPNVVSTHVTGTSVEE